MDPPRIILDKPRLETAKRQDNNHATTCSPSEGTNQTTPSKKWAITRQPHAPFRPSLRPELETGKRQDKRTNHGPRLPKIGQTRTAGIVSLQLTNNKQLHNLTPKAARYCFPIEVDSDKKVGRGQLVRHSTWPNFFIIIGGRVRTTGTTYGTIHTL